MIGGYHLIQIRKNKPSNYCFLRKNEVDHPIILFNNIPVKKVDEHKHLGIMLDSKLSFSSHIKSAISKMSKGIGLLKYLSKYLPGHTLNELYKLYVRRHLDYGNVIHHIPAKLCEFSKTVQCIDAKLVNLYC